MQTKTNYKKLTDAIIAENAAGKALPHLLLHCCCAPCSSAVLQYLQQGFLLDIYFFNPNITDRQEYTHRLEEQKRLIAQMPLQNPVGFLEAPYNPQEFLQVCKGLEDAPEGGKRCEKCFELRLGATAKAATAGDYDYFATTLTLSPLKNAALINKIGQSCTNGNLGTKYLPSDFKKGDGYKNSLELSKQYGLYRQNYCGCEFSRKAISPPVPLDDR
ncbi:MAG: epoxyqueuosine reductase QueH [Oscillospiraceae bacterium]|jgi:predicted adenine nucleotide alpha hydrolase (AANH) superfamily ATPase|nr:epoxyqueuosine reductase QueH [Oscillospiraceae bacterium]